MLEGPFVMTRITVGSKYLIYTFVLQTIVVLITPPTKIWKIDGLSRKARLCILVVEKNDIMLLIVLA